MAIIDFHSHMLPGIDDGSPNVETSLKMLHMAREQGVGLQLLTPHYYPWKEEIDRFLARREESAQALRAVLTPDLPAIRVGAEVAFFPRMSRRDMSALCVEGTKVLLVELPFESWDARVTDELASLCLDRGYDVVLAHVERFLSYRGNAELLEDFTALPLKMQINTETFLKWSSRRRGLEMIRSGMAQLLGSDAHNLTNRQPNLAAGRRVIEKKLGAEALRTLDETAAELLAPESVVEVR